MGRSGELQPALRREPRWREGLSHGREIKGPFCGYDPTGTSWDEFLKDGPPAHVRMPASVAAEIRAYAARRFTR